MQKTYPYCGPQPMDIDLNISAITQHHPYCGPQPMDIDLNISAITQHHPYLGPQPMDIDLNISAITQHHPYLGSQPDDISSIVDVSRVLRRWLNTTFQNMPNDTTISIQAHNDQYQRMFCDFIISFSL
jgi:endogenous inhibitor of DNA gyrase (YacG/DUF329 family)